MLAEKSGGVVEWSMQTTRAPAPLLWLRAQKHVMQMKKEGWNLQVLLFYILKIFVGTHFYFFASGFVANDDAMRVLLQG